LHEKGALAANSGAEYKEEKERERKESLIVKVIVVAAVPESQRSQRGRILSKV